MERCPKKIQRTSLMQSYRTNMINYLIHTRGCDEATAAAAMDKIIQSQITQPKIRSVDTVSYGNTKVSTVDLGKYVSKIKNKIVCPSGSVYQPEHKKTAFLCKMIKDGLVMRKAVKKKKLEALGIGDKIAAEMHDYGQASIKIKLNSLPGGLGSPFNLFYDKGGYNAITSSARALIANSYCCAEQLLGGNYAWFTESEAINHVMVALAKCPDEKTITNTISKYHLKTPTRDELFDFMHKTVRQYKYSNKGIDLRKIINSIPQHVVSFIYYMGNLRHLLWNNDEYVRVYIRQILSQDLNIDTSGVEPKDIWSLDEDLLAVVLTVMSDSMKNVKLSEIVTAHPEKAKLIAANGRLMQERINYFDDMFKVFIYHDCLTPNILTRKTMFRNTVIISDTDSVIYTSKAWVDWFVGHTEKIVDDSYNISALATYWLTKVNSDVMAKFSIAQGATNDNVPVMQMKNEFLYPALLLYDIKKTYAAIIKIVEGVILPEPKPDLKGQAIRGSSVAKEARDFCEDLIINKILKPSMEGQISAGELIRLCVDFEMHIRESIMNGETTYLQNQSVKMANEYANPDSSAWLYAEAWNAIFSDYGAVTPPDKLPCAKLVTPTTEFYENLERNDPERHAKFCKFVESKGKFPSSIVIAPTSRKIPKEIIPLVDVRTIIYKNMKPVYITLERLNITVGFSKKELLLSEVYI